MVAAKVFRGTTDFVYRRAKTECVHQSRELKCRRVRNRKTPTQHLFEPIKSENPPDSGVAQSFDWHRKLNTVTPGDPLCFHVGTKLRGEGVNNARPQPRKTRLILRRPLSRVGDGELHGARRGKLTP